jgi:uncharacterized phage protein (TIGR01671 family)
MRSIKYRAWHAEEKQMGYWDELSFTNTGAHPHPLVPGEPEHIHLSNVFEDLQEAVILMESTCLFDKNKKEIYEGDILIKTYWDIEADGMKTGTFEVKWDDGCLRAWQLGVEQPIVVDVNQESSEIIGNIYENPGLLMPN